jgi:transposase
LRREWRTTRVAFISSLEAQLLPLSREPFKMLMMVRRLVVAVLLLIVAAGLWLALAPRRTPAGQSALTEVPDVEAFRRWFNDSASGVRVIVLLSPT